MNKDKKKYIPPIDEIINVMYGNKGKSSFLNPYEIKSRTSYNTYYSKRRKGVDYETFGEPCPIEK